MTHLDEFIIIVGVIGVVLVADVPSVKLDIVGVLRLGVWEAECAIAA
jgi:hypothetical protein